MPRRVSSWMLVAYEDLEAADEPAELEEDVELLIESHLLLASELASSLMAPPAWGFREEKEGEEEEDEEENAFQLLLMLLRVPPRLQALCTWQSCSVSWCCMRCTPLVLRRLSLVVLLVHVAIVRECLLLRRQAQMLCIMARVDQQDSTSAVVCLWLVLLVSRCASFCCPQA